MKAPNKDTYQITYFLKKSHGVIVAGWKGYEIIEGKECVVGDYQVCSIGKGKKILKDCGWDGDIKGLDTDLF